MVKKGPQCGDSVQKMNLGQFYIGYVRYGEKWRLSGLFVHLWLQNMALYKPFPDIVSYLIQIPGIMFKLT